MKYELVCFGQEDSRPLGATVGRYFTPGYAQCTDGALCDRTASPRRVLSCLACQAVTDRGSASVENEPRGERMAMPYTHLSDGV
jgi:hypothetical protein